MSPHITSTVVVLKTLTLVLGALITFLAWKAYRRTSARPLLLLALGFGVITFGNLLAGLADQLLGLESTIALTLESGLNAAGFAVIVYSLYTE